MVIRCAECRTKISDDNLGMLYRGRYYCDKCIRNLINEMYEEVLKMDVGAGDDIDRLLQENYKKHINDQEAKADAGKPRLSLVPVEIIRCIARVREFAQEKYKDANSWKRVEIERYRDALFRHMLLYIENPSGKDEESGLPHLWHLACNVAFLCEMEKE